MSKALTYGITERRYENADINDVVGSVSALVGQLNSIPILRGQLIENITLSAITPLRNAVRHRLGARARGAIVVLQSVDANIRVLPSSSSNEISLTTTAQVTVSLWVF